MGNQPLRTLLLASLAGLALSLAACTRSASTPVPTVAGEEGTPAQLPPQQATMEAVRSALLTQTAQAGEGVPTQTPEPTEGTQDVAPTPAPSNTPVTVPSPTALQANTYTLQEGEHPYCIARRLNVNPDELLAASGLTRLSLTQPGTRLTIPQTGNPFPGPRALSSHPTTYTVLSGDTLAVIACKFGDVDPQAIAVANGLQSPFTLQVGTVLNIP